ncbi:hypothetical protein BS50DRAFT_498441 [Corynespora cassiicola Philippines]|uniref:C3H1-type domain-containing protein n=1 Tax=Corynespora cassiicola Philippines TaxID=1448308 RepID=A0A2T2NGG4_CORCC|nr:hypothetical protein BS50DRAFT_498441 [Corynespora cassiicola Philippines]
MAGANGNGPMPVPGGSHGRMGNGHGHGANMREMGFGGPRSPPNNKSTSHVPCKFYRQGACQAGKACPFLHSDEPLAERAPCKYFTKGNCKFGPKCALAHILPNGHVVNRNHIGGSSHFNRVNIQHHNEPAPNSSLLTMQAHMAPMQPNYPFPGQDEYFGGHKPYDMIPTIDTTFSSHPGSNYGSPPNENGRLPISPVQKGLSVMDVQLPASFDSQGVSHAARYGPMASSVPAKFLANSPPSSFQGDSPALRNLHDSAFGDGSRRAAALGSSPPESIEQPIGRRILHSELGGWRSRNTLSSSVGARPALAMNDDWDESDLIGKFEEELLPSSLNDLLTPQEKMRRFSRDHGDNDGNSLSHRTSLSRLGASPTASDLKVGSPTGLTSSPSRFQSFWGKSRTSNNDGMESGSLPGTSAFGHVGSPLRNSTLHPGASPSLRAMNRPTSGEASPFVSSPPRQASMSMISQQLQRTRLSSRASEEPGLHPGVPRVTSASSMGSTGGRLGMDRAVSSSSINRERIEEEQGLFSMEEEEDMNAKSKDGASTTSSSSNKRLSGLSWGSGGKASPSLAPIGGHRAGANASGAGRENGPWGNNA